MPTLSIVLPIYNVETYLAQCLDSIISQEFQDLEIIAVDDASTDLSSQILKQYAQSDARIRVVSLAENGGLGNARNVGMSVAAGKYIWFIDSDDWLAEDVVSPCLQRLQDTGAEVLIFGWQRVYENGHTFRGGGQALLSTAPAVTNISEWLAGIDILQVAWNKILERSLLTRIDFQFDPGWYEDTPFTYSVLSAAQTVTTLDKVCINYRQRNMGSITRTTSDRHFEIFEKWETAFSRIAVIGNAKEPLLQKLFLRMMRHYATILRNPRRLPPESKKHFFSNMARHYARYKPATIGAPTGRFDRLTNYFIEKDWYWAYRRLLWSKGIFLEALRRLRLAAR